MESGIRTLSQELQSGVAVRSCSQESGLKVRTWSQDLSQDLESEPVLWSQESRLRVWGQKSVLCVRSQDLSQDFECGVTNLECRVQTLSHESGPWIHIWSEGSGLGVTSVYLEARGWTWIQGDGLGVRSQDL